jgi:hypothetical protein
MREKDELANGDADLSFLAELCDELLGHPSSWMVDTTTT